MDFSKLESVITAGTVGAFVGGFLFKGCSWLIVWLRRDKAAEIAAKKEELEELEFADEQYRNLVLTLRSEIERVNIESAKARAEIIRSETDCMNLRCEKMVLQATIRNLETDIALLARKLEVLEAK